MNCTEDCIVPGALIDHNSLKWCYGCGAPICPRHTNYTDSDEDHEKPLCLDCLYPAQQAAERHQYQGKSPSKW